MYSTNSYPIFKQDHMSEHGGWGWSGKQQNDETTNKAIINHVNPLKTENPQKGTLAYSEDLAEMSHSATFHQGLHCLVMYTFLWKFEHATHGYIHVRACTMTHYRFIVFVDFGQTFDSSC